MSKAKAVSETPTEVLSKMIDTANAYDERGRLITVNRLNALQFYRLTKAMGATANNPAAMDLAVIASSVTKIDATNIAVPATEREVEFLISAARLRWSQCGRRGTQETLQGRRSSDRRRKKLSQRPAFKLRVAACGGKIPFDVAFSADDDFVLAWIIADGENNGGEFDWPTIRWLPRK